MPVDYKIANHTCNVIRRHIKAAFPEFDILFIVHGEHERKKAFLRETSKIMEHPAGHYIVEHLRESPTHLTQQRSSFVGLAKSQTHGFLGFFRSTSIAVLIFINHDRFNSEENLRNHALHLIWHAITLIRDKSETTLKKLRTDGFIAPELNDFERCHTNLTADIFSACFQKLQGKNDVFESLIKLRMSATLSPEKGFIAENFPFPMCLETLEVILQDQFETTNKKYRHVSESVKIADEIGITYKNKSILQWANFAKPAQEMAWCGFEKEVILGCALYTSENTYIRSIADMVAEKLEIKPAIITNQNDYNPFTEFEANQRLHNKKSQENLRLTLQKLYTTDDFSVFIKEAKLQNQRLLSGNPIGWSVNALIAAANTTKSTEPDTLTVEELRNNAEQMFNLINKNQSYETLQSFVHIIFKARREGILINNEFLDITFSGNPNFTEIITAIQQIQDVDKQGSIDKMGTKNITSFISPNALK